MEIEHFNLGHANAYIAACGNQSFPDLFPCSDMACRSSPRITEMQDLGIHKTLQVYR